MIRQCLHCGDSFEAKTGRKYCNTSCKDKYVPSSGKSRNQLSSQRVTEWRRRIKQRAIDYKGGKCLLCGYNKCNASLDFHHIDPKEKDFAIGSDGNTRGWDVIQPELDKCVLLCRNCHGEVHAGVTKIEYCGVEQLVA